MIRQRIRYHREPGKGAQAPAPVLLDPGQKLPAHVDLPPSTPAPPAQQAKPLHELTFEEYSKSVITINPASRWDFDAAMKITTMKHVAAIRRALVNGWDIPRANLLWYKSNIKFFSLVRAYCRNKGIEL